MSTDFILPDIGEGIVECELLKWLVSEGDRIIEDQPVAEVMTDKATVEIPAMHDGIVEKLYYTEGDIAKVHAPLFRMKIDSHSPAETEQESANNEDSKTPASPASNTSIEVFMLPDIGEGIVECEIVRWAVAEGEVVEEDQVIVEVMTDKAVVEIPAKYAGRIEKLHYAQGDIAKVHAPLFDLRLEAVLTDGSEETSPTYKESDTHQADQQSHVRTQSTQSSDKQGELFEPPRVSDRPIASPAVRRLAREQNIDLRQIKGSGAKGRVLKQDLANKGASTRSHAPKQGQSETKAEDNFSLSNTREASTDRTEAMRGIKAAMAKQMKASVYSIPHFTVTDELQMDALIEVRSRLKAEFEKQGIKLSFMPFFIKALSLALNEFPVINARLSEDESEITYLGAHNIGVAVDSKIGLLVPNIKNVEQKSLKEVAIDLNRLIEAAREGKLSNQDLSGGSISISNIGAIGGITATPIINKPDVAIVALGKTQCLPRFDEQMKVQAVNIMTVSWSGDHRVIDGATMVKFNNLWMDYLMHPEKMLINLR